MKPSIIIIGGGMAGLTAGIYGQSNGFATRIFEMHTVAGGQCTSWQRKGYTFDVCIHHLMGCSPWSHLYELWQSVGALPMPMVYPQECVAVADGKGNLYRDYYNLDTLEAELLRLAPEDEAQIGTYISGIRALSKHDLMGTILTGKYASLLPRLPILLGNMKWFQTTMAAFAAGFKSPFLQRAFPLLVYSTPEAPVFLHMVRHASGVRGDLAWPLGGSSQFARGIEERYRALGGEIQYKSKVTEILTENKKAVGIRLADGTIHKADYIISTADGRKTLRELLRDQFTNDELRALCTLPENDRTNWAVHVFLGVNRDLTAEPSSLVLLLDEPATIAGQECHSLEMQIYGLDSTMAPPGKGTIKVELYSTASYWEALDQEAYDKEKRHIAEQVIALLESHFPGISGQVEAIDVPTLRTWERFMGGTRGFANGPNKPFGPKSMLQGTKGMIVPGLENFYLAGVWATAMGALFANANSGRTAIKLLCRKEGRRFTAPIVEQK